MKRIMGWITVFLGFQVYNSYAHVILPEILGTVHSQELREKQKKYFGSAVEENITFQARQNSQTDKTIVRHAIILTKPEARATVLICHGFMCTKKDILCLRSIFSDYNTMIFDFRAHGENSENQCCTFGRDEAYDVMGAVQYIKSRPDLKNKPLIAYGFSMGAASSIIAQSLDNSLFDAAIWDCPFDSTQKIIGRAIENLKINLFGYDFAMPGRTFLNKYAYHPYIQSLLKAALKTVAKMDATQVNTCIAPVSPAEAIKHVAIPCLFIGCRDDEKSPIEAVRAVYDGAAGYKRLLITPGRHFGSYFNSPERYAHKLRTFIEKVLDERIAQSVQQKIIEDLQ